MLMSIPYLQVQVKSAKQICHLCADTEPAMQQWATAIRLLLERERLLDNYNRVLAKMQTGIGKECLYAQIRREQVRRAGLAVDVLGTHVVQKR